MTLKSTTTIVDFKNQLVTQLAPRLTTVGPDGGPVTVSYSWPGGTTEPNSVFLGRRPEGVQPPSLRVDSKIPNMKAARKQRQESYDVEVTILSVSPELSPLGAATADLRAFTIHAALDNLLADDPKIGLTTIQWAVLDSTEILFGGPFEYVGGGYAVLLLCSISVEARLI